MNIFVSNLGINVQNEHLGKYFSKYGKASSVNIVMDKVTQLSRGFAFIYMKDPQGAEKAIRELDGMVLDGSTIKVIESRRKPE